MSNRRREPVSYRPFRAEPLLADGLLPVARGGGEPEAAASDAFFRLAARFGERADAETEAAAAQAGDLAGVDGAPDVTMTGGRSVGVAAAPSGGGKQLTGNKAEKAARAKTYLMQKHGWSDLAASGLVGQFAQESAFNTRAINPGDGNDGSDSIGLAQWNGRRAKGLRAFAAQQGRPVDDFELQLDYVVHELNSSEAGVGRRLKAARNIDEATAAAIGYERPQGWTPQNPRGGHGWANRLAAARSVYGGGAPPAAAAAPAGVDGTATTAAVAAPAAAASGADPSFTFTGGGFRPMKGNTLYSRTFNAHATKTYLQAVDNEMRSNMGQAFDLYGDDPATLQKAFGALKGEFAKDHVFPEIMADYSLGFDRMAESFLGQSRDRAMRKAEAADRAAFEARGQELATEQARKIAGFDPSSAAASNAIASDQQAIEDHWDDAVRRGIVDADDAERAKIAGRRETALQYYGKQADAFDADGVATMRKEMQEDFAGGGLPGLDGEGWQTLDKGLKALEVQKRNAAERVTAEFRERGDTMAARLLQGFDIDPSELNKYMLDAGKTPQGKAALQETFAKISAGRAINDFSLADGKAYVDGLKKQYGKDATAAELRQYAFAANMLEEKRKAIVNDPVSYAEAHGIVPETPMLTEAATAEDMVKIMSGRVAAAGQAATELGTQPRFLKAGEAKALAASIRADPAKGASVSAAIVAGAGKQAAEVLSEFGADAPIIAESGAILAFDGSARAAEDVILGYGKGLDGKQLKGLKPDAARESFAGVTGQALALAGKDRERIERAAASIARKRISEEGLDPDSEEALALHALAVNEAAGAVIDRGVQYGGFVDFGAGFFAGGQKVLAPNYLRADKFEDVILLVNDADLDTLAVKPKAGIGWHQFGRKSMTPARTLRDAVPVAVDGGYAFARGDPNGEDPQFVQGDDGKIFVLDLESLRDRLEPRTPGAWR